MALSAVILCVVCVLWPVLAADGGLAFNSVAGLAALFMAGSLKKIRPQWYMAPLAGFFVYAAVSAIWSPRPFNLIEINFATHAFNMRSEVARVGLLFVALAIVMAGAMQMSDQARRRVQRFVVGGLLVQALIVLAATTFEQHALQLFSPLMSNMGEGVQNIARNALIMAVAAPALIYGLAERRSWIVAIAIVAVIVGMEGWSILHRGIEAGGRRAAFGALVAAAICITTIRILPRSGFRVMSIGMAVLVLAAPLVFGAIAHGADPALVTDSTGQRLIIWNRAVEIIMQHPLFGNGLGVLRTIRDTVPSGMFAGELLMPNHPHNMALELWAETGLVGAALLAAAIVMAGWRLPAPAEMGDAAPRIAGLIGGMMTTGFVSFDLWNEWWWAVGGLLAIFAASLPAPATSPSPIVSKPTAGDRPVFYPPAIPTRSLDNNFNLLRLVFALMVAIYHLVSLSGVAGWSWLVRPLSVCAEIGVEGFFVLSGYLVYGSLERSSGLAQYAAKRARRLYPAYAVVVLLCALAALGLSGAADSDLGDVASYLAANLTFLNFLHPNLPGIFVSNPVTEVNGALWTLKIEVMFYIALPVIAWMLQAAGRFRWVLLSVIYILAEAWRYLLPRVGAEHDLPILAELARQLPGQLSFFITGIGLYLWRQHRITWLVIPGAILLVALSVIFPWAAPGRALGLGILTIAAGVGLPRPFDAARFGDLSYGLYIIHFPVIQTLVAIGLFAASPWLGAGAVLAAVLAGALAMWWLVERPALRADSAYRLHT